MKRISTYLAVLIAAILMVVVPQGKAQQFDYDQDRQQDYSRQDHSNVDRGRVDRYLEVEVWTNDNDGEYYVGDKIVLNFRSNRDAFVAIYSIDTRGRVNLLFPANRNGDNYIRGGVIYRMPDNADDFDLVVDGPAGVENIQIIASRERFPIPDWYPESGLISDAEDRHDYMDYLNDRYFVRYEGQRFSYDRTAAYVYEWEEDYFRPVYYPDYPSWTVVGNAYIDYPFGSSVYINGLYWGTTPLYIPSIYVGWHTISIYDSYGYGWESDFHVTRYNTVVFDRNQIHTSPSIKSKYREVRLAGYRDPVQMGYRDYNSKKAMIASARGMSVAGKGGFSGKNIKKNNWNGSSKKKYVRGTNSLVQTDRGWEAKGSNSYKGRKSGSTSGGYAGRTKSRGSSGKTYGRSKQTVGSSKRNSGASSSRKKSIYSDSKSSGRSGKSYYQKKSGSSMRSKGGSSYKKSKGYKKSSKTKVGSRKSSMGSKSSGGSKRSSFKKSSGRKSSSGSVGKRSSGRSSSGKSSVGRGSSGRSSSGKSSVGRSSSGRSSGSKSSGGSKRGKGR